MLSKGHIESIGVGTKISLGKDVWMTDFQSPSLGKSFVPDR